MLKSLSAGRFFEFCCTNSKEKIRVFLHTEDGPSIGFLINVEFLFHKKPNKKTGLFSP